MIFTCISVPPFAGWSAAPAPATKAAPALFEMACAAWRAACADADYEEEKTKLIKEKASLNLIGIGCPFNDGDSFSFRGRVWPHL